MQFDTINGFFGEYGGVFVPEELKKELNYIDKQYQQLKKDPNFIEELHDLYKHYSGRPTPTYFAKSLSKKYGAQIYLKREDLNHTGAHKLNHCLGEVLLAKKMGKKKVVAETGAGQHGVALATAATLLGLECDIYMGAVDIEKEKPNVIRMKLLGAKVIPVTIGLATLKEAVDIAFQEYLKDIKNQFYAIGSVVGPHPFPQMVQDFQSIVGQEARQQFLELTGGLPDHLVACIGGGSNAIGLFRAFLEDESVKMHGVEPAGQSFKVGEHAATLTKGTPGILHGFRSYLLQDEQGNPSPVNTIASGLDYPGVGPVHSYLKDIKKVSYHTITDKEALEGFFTLCKSEGIIPALESSHAVAFVKKLAKKCKNSEKILINLSGRGDKDLEYIESNYM